MAKTKEELETLKKECSELSKKMKELTPEEMKEISGGRSWGYFLAIYSIQNDSAEEARDFIIFNKVDLAEDMESLKQLYFEQFGIKLVVD